MGVALAKVEEEEVGGSKVRRVIFTPTSAGSVPRKRARFPGCTSVAAVRRPGTVVISARTRTGRNTGTGAGKYRRRGGREKRQRTNFINTAHHAIAICKTMHSDPFYDCVVTWYIHSIVVVHVLLNAPVLRYIFRFVVDF